MASRAAKGVCDQGRGVGSTRLAVYLDFADSIKRLGREAIDEKYGNLFEMYNRITGEDPYATPMRIYPAVHYTMGGLWVDYDLMSTIPGLYVIGEANFSDHGANRLGASALMQGLADGYFIVPYTIGQYLADVKPHPVATDQASFEQVEAETLDRIHRLLSNDGTQSPRALHRQLGQIMWDQVGMARNAAGLKRALQEIPKLREEFWRDLKVPGSNDTLNKNLEFAGRVADYLELGELMALDAFHREESCGAHFREEHQTAEGEAVRNDENMSFVSIWEHQGSGTAPALHRENLHFEFAELKTRSYK